LKHLLLPTGAIAASTIAVLGATPIPVIGGASALLDLSVGASVILWIATLAERNHQQASEARTEIAEVRAEVDEIRRHTKIERLLVDAGAGSALTLPKPHGDIRPIPTDIDGETVLVGVDKSADLADVIDLRRAMADHDRAAQ
jgi:hypothetical protein